MDDVEIVQTARRMVEAGGLASLSMRKLAGELGVAPTAIYWHVGGRDEVLGRVLDEMLRELPPPEPVGVTARERILSLAHGVRDQVRSTPVLRSLAIDLGRTAEAALPAQVALCREMTAAGLHGEAAAAAAHAVLYTVGGYVVLDSMLASRLAGAPAAHRLWAGIDPDGLDAELVAAMRRPPSVDEIFDLTLQRLLDALLPR